MNYSQLPVTRIAGSGRITLPEYGTLKVSGSGRISSEELSTSGSSTIPGGLTLRRVKTSGSTKIEGNITADEIKFSGSAKVEGTLECEELVKSGSLSIEGSLKARYVRLSGSTKVSKGGAIERELESSGSVWFGDDLVSDDQVLFRGVMKIDGKVQAKSFEARFSRGESNIRGGIYADYVNIQRSHEDWRNLGTLVTSDIYGDEIILENVACDNVKGKKVTIKKGCLIKGIIEYSESIQVDEASTIENTPKKIE